ncbi:uncharacterized protein LOC143614924 [Bidens hawaiensis]|uniref:uncharacterized protein LOC143614924 n=1 Tax=Bidens hawaiensis TaxID=980011 RepID=UPI0040490C3E
MLNKSTLFNHILDWGVSKCSFIVNETEYTQGYYLADGIYPECSTLVKSFTNSKDPNSIKFKQRHKAARKDVVKAFDVLQARWAIVRGVGRAWSMKVISDILYTCITLHNMIVENEGSDVTNWSSGDEDEDDDDTEDDDDDSSNYTRGAVMEFEQSLKKFDDLCDMSMNRGRRDGLKEQIWKLEN